MSYLRNYIPHDSDLRRIWLAANGGKIDDQFCKNVHIHDICKEILGLPDEVPFREIATLMGGVAIVQKLKTKYLNENFEKFQNKLQYAIEGKDSSNMANEEFDFKDVESRPIMTDSDDDLGTGYLSNDGSGGAKDAFWILSCKEIRIPILESSEIEAAAVGGQVINHVDKKALIQEALPTFIYLNAQLKKTSSSQVLGYLMESFIKISRMSLMRQHVLIKRNLSVIYKKYELGANVPV